MKKGYAGLLLPMAALPYVTLFALAGMFGSTHISFFRWMMERVFQNNAWYLIGAVGCFVAFSIGFCVIFFLLSIRNRWDPVALVKIALTIKCIQIPAYLLAFALGVVMLITIFTFPFTIALCFLNGVTLILSGLVSIASVVNAERKKYISRNEAVGFAVLQFVFVVDVISAFILFRRLSKANNR